MWRHGTGEDKCLSVQVGLGSRETGFIFSFETMKVFVGLEVRSIILANVFTLMISLLLFCIPEWVINMTA